MDVRPSAHAPLLRHRDETAPHSLALLSHMRWIAAFVVVVSHAKQAILGVHGYTPPPHVGVLGLVTKPAFRVEGYGHAAVIVFFVLSGFLVGGKVLKLLGTAAITTDWQHFLIDRFSRIFIVLIPALAFSLAVFLVLSIAIPQAPFVAEGRWSPALSDPIAGDALFLRWGAAAVLINEFVTQTILVDAPLWSLAYEWFYYVAALACVLVIRRVISFGAGLVIFYALVLFLLACVRQPDIILSAVTWMLGLGARMVFDRSLLTGRLFQIGGIAAVIGVLAAYRLHPLPDVILGFAVALLISHTAWRRMKVSFLGEELARFSYSLYVTHYPVLLSIMGALFAAGYLSHPLPAGIAGYGCLAASICLTVGFAKLFAMLTEDHTAWLRNLLLTRLRSQARSR